MRNSLLICVRKLQKLIHCHDSRIAQNETDIKTNACNIEDLKTQLAALQQTVQANSCNIQANRDDISTHKDTLCRHEAWLRYIARYYCYIDDFPKNPPSSWALSGVNSAWA